ncbi:MAG TPA: C25 family cysteine peptidase, partial [Planctomycetota bacterium]|nr:C25 family cysteine peptidase [Planctomycetota bacterium]
AANYAFYASDLYYADLATADGAFDDWNGSRESFHARYFGEVRGESNKQDPINYDRVSYAPEIAVGRWPVHTPAEAALVAQKTLAHRPQEKPRALLVHADGWIDARPSARAMAESLTQRGFTVEAQLYGDEANAPTPARTLAGLVRGPALALHLGHGSDQGWHLCLGEAERVQLASAPPAVFLSIGCSTAHFVNEPPYQPYLDEAGVPHRGTNAGEQFTAPPPPPHWLQPGAYDSSGFGAELVRSGTGGALVYIGCDTGAQPCALTLLDAFQGALRTAAAPRVGDAWRLALAQYVEREKLMALTPNDDWYPPSIFFQGMKFVFLGDPTLKL